MSNAQTAEATQGTRQLLDELDALMDQMLALPIADQENAQSDRAEAEPQSPSGPPATISATLTLLDPSPSLNAAQEPVDMAPAVRVADPAPTLYAPQEDIAPIPLLYDVAAPKVVKPMALPARPHTERWRPGGISYQFLRWVNQGYDQSTTLLGRPGDLLRGRWARRLLGLIGLGLLAVALGWLCKDWMGWNW